MNTLDGALPEPGTFKLMFCDGSHAAIGFNDRKYAPVALPRAWLGRGEAP